MRPWITRTPFSNTSFWGALLMCAILAGVHPPGLATADSQSIPSPWLGQRFAPDQQTLLVPGETDFTRKLCRITYQIRAATPGVSVEAALFFNPRFVPRRPASVTLEILLLDRQGVCVAQIDQELAVTGEPLSFAFTVADTAVTAVRTYYTLHYP